VSLKFGEAPERSLPVHIEAVEYPTTRDQLVDTAMDNGAPVDAINVFKSLPRQTYNSQEDVLRDLAEAARRFATGNLAVDDDGVDRDRRNIGRDAVESAPNGRSRHP